MQILGNTVVFALLYILCMIPTYILPYFGSNSTGLNVIAGAAGVFSPMLLLHLGFLVALVIGSWFRGCLVHKRWLIIFPLLAMVFDLVPILNSIPFVPTIMHLLAIIIGVMSVSPVHADRAPAL